MPEFTEVRLDEETEEGIESILSSDPDVLARRRRAVERSAPTYHEYVQAQLARERAEGKLPPRK